MDLLFPIAVRVKGEDAGKGWWIMAFDGERFLLSTEDGIGFRWVNIDACLLVRVLTPEQPQPVVIVQPVTIAQQSPPLMVDSKLLRRNG